MKGKIALLVAIVVLAVAFAVGVAAAAPHVIWYSPANAPPSQLYGLSRGKSPSRQARAIS